VLYLTFKFACYTLDFLDDDKEWHEAINQASHWASRKQICELFVIKLMSCEVVESYILWENARGSPRRFSWHSPNLT
jgi:hypothetical protein